VTVLLTTLLLTALAASPADADPSLSFARTYEAREARLLPGVELQSDYRLPQTPMLRLLQEGAVGFVSQLPLPLALDTGGGLRSDTKPIVALLLGLIIGFGTGHLIAGDQDGFLLFLIVDVAIIVVGAIFQAAFGVGVFWGLGLLVSHIIQGIDAYQTAGGQRIVQLTRERAVELADVAHGVPAPGREASLVTTRLYAVSF
jgi:hypothetical protein